MPPGQTIYYACFWEDLLKLCCGAASLFTMLASGKTSYHNAPILSWEGPLCFYFAVGRKSVPIPPPTALNGNT